MPGRTQNPPLPSLRARAERLLEERTRHLAARTRNGAAAEPTQSVLVCALGEEFYGLPVSVAAHVLPATPCAPLPGAPPAVLGLLGRAGQVFSVLDLGLALGRAGAARPEVADGHILLLRHAPRRFALRVDRVLGVAEVRLLAQPGPAGPERAVSGHAWLPPALLPSAIQTGGRRPVLALIELGRLLQPYLSSAEPSRPDSSRPDTSRSVTT